MAHAAPDPNSTYTPDQRRWFQTLMEPNSQRSCCGVSDCRETAGERIGADGQYEVFVTKEQQWVTVPNNVVLRGVENLIGRPIVCYRTSRNFSSGGLDFTVFCYVPGFRA